MTHATFDKEINKLKKKIFQQVTRVSKMSPTLTVSKFEKKSFSIDV